MARKMVCEWGMSDAMGPLTFGKKEEQIFLGREIAQHQDYSEDTALRIDQEVKRFVTDNYERARKVLSEHQASLEKVAAELLVREVLDGEQVRRIVAGLPLEDTKTATPAGPVSSTHDEEHGRRKERPGIVPPLADPLPQE
jgi:cell division protease FtsH